MRPYPPTTIQNPDGETGTMRARTMATAPETTELTIMT